MGRRIFLYALVVHAGFALVRARVFGGGVSQGTINSTEQVLLNHTLSEGHICGVVTSWWTGGATSDDSTTLRFYVDGEATASIVVDIANACGTAFGEESAPWGTEWFGKGARTTGWWNSIPIPFQRSIVVTYSNPAATTTWLYVHGVESTTGFGCGMRFGALDVPWHARLQVQVTRGTFAPLTYIDLAAMPPATAGGPTHSYLFKTFLAVDSANLNVLEGCFRAFNAFDNSTADGKWPGVLLATGTEVRLPPLHSLYHVWRYCTNS